MVETTLTVSTAAQAGTQYLPGYKDWSIDAMPLTETDTGLTQLENQCLLDQKFE